MFNPQIIRNMYPKFQLNNPNVVFMIYLNQQKTKIIRHSFYQVLLPTCKPD